MIDTDSKLTALWQRRQYSEIICIATRTAPNSFSENALFMIAEAFEHSGRPQETAQAYLAALKKSDKRASEAAFNLLSKLLVTPASQIYSQFCSTVLNAIGKSDATGTARLLRYVVNVDLHFYESILWRYLALPNPNLSFAIRLMTFGGTAYLEKYRNRILELTRGKAHVVLLEAAAAYSLGKHQEAMRLLTTIDPDPLSDDEIGEYLVIKNATLFALGEYEGVGVKPANLKVTPAIKIRLLILKANAKFAAGAYSEAHAIRWHVQTGDCGAHLGVSNLNENAFLKSPTQSNPITLVADEGLGDTIYFMCKYRQFIKQKTFLQKLAVPAKHMTVMRQILVDLGITLKIVDKTEVLSCVTGSQKYQTKLAFLSNIPHLLCKDSPKWFLQPGVLLKKFDLARPSINGPRIVVSCKTFRLRNRMEREIDFELVLSVLTKFHCEILLLDDDNAYQPTSQEASSPRIRRLTEKASARPELAYEAIKSADLYIGICNTYVYMAGLLGVPSFCLLPLTPRDIWIDRGELRSPFASVSIAKKDSATGWNDALASLDEWIKKATPCGVA